MRINKIACKVKSAIDKSKQYCQEKQIQRYFRMDDTVRYTDAGQQIYEARHGLARYAKANKMFVEIKNWRNPRHNYDIDLSKLEIRTGKLKDPLHNNYLYYSVVNSDVSKTYFLNQKDMFVPIKDGNARMVRTCVSNTEDTFLKHIYRTVEILKEKMFRYK